MFCTPFISTCRPYSFAQSVEDSAAKLYGLHVLMNGVQNNENNYTRFICIMPIVVNALPTGYIAGDYWEPQWCRAVIINAHMNESKCKLAAGTHKLRFYGIDAGVVLQKIVVYRGELPQSYLGPEE